MVSTADVSAYLERIGLDRSAIGPEPSIEALRLLHRAHLESVPFENLDIHLGRAIELDVDRFVSKIVDDRRGGFCYELNSAFGSLLSALGYDVTLLEARVFVHGPTADPEPGIAFDHLCLLVDLDRRYLVDVGFGDSFVEPLPFDSDADHLDPAGTFRVVAVPVDAAPVDDGSVGDEAVSTSSQWFDLLRDGEAQYRFCRAPRTLEAFEPGCRHHQTAETSPFTRRPISSRLTATGRVTLSGYRLIETVDGERTEQVVERSGLGEVLVTRFGLALAEDDLAALAAASQQGAVLFDTAIGRCGVGWVEQRITVVALPEANDAATLSRLRSVVGESTGAKPPTFVQRGIEAMVALIAGSRRDLRDLLVDLDAVPEFDRVAYEVARTIPPGEVMTYGAVAKRLGQPGGAQAVGGAMGRNPVPLIVPCHRVVAADGQLGGFSANGGTVTKRRLLEIEGAPIDRPLF